MGSTHDILSFKFGLRSVLELQVSSKTGSCKAPESSEPSEIVAESFVKHGDLVSV